MKKRLAVICVFLIVFMGITTIASAALSFTLSVPDHGGYKETGTATKTDSNRANAKVSFTTLTATIFPVYARVYFSTGPSAATNQTTVNGTGTVYLKYNSGYGFYKDPYRLRVTSNGYETYTFTAKGTFTP
jgi:hypothetical protein